MQRKILVSIKYLYVTHININHYALFDEFGGDEARALYDYLISTDKKIEISDTTYDDKYNIVPRETFMKIY